MDNIITTPIVGEVEQSFLDYSLSVITDRAIPSAEVTESLAKDGITKGTYKVGKDIEAGEYKITTETDTYWERTDKNGEIIDNDNFTNNAYVTVKKGEYFKLTDGKAEKVK